MAFECPTESRLDESTTYQGQSDIPTPKHEFLGHLERFTSIVFLHDNVHIVSGAWNGTMRKWNCKTGLPVGEPWEKKRRGPGVSALALSPDGKTIACGRYDGRIQRWTTNGEMVKGIWTHGGSVQSLSWSPSGGRLASGSVDRTFLIRNAESGEVEVGPIKTDQECRGLAFSPLGDRIATSGGGTRTGICIRDSVTGRILVGPIDDLGSVHSIVWSLDGSKIYTADSFVRVLDSKSGTELYRFEHFDFPFSIALSSKHNLLAAVGHDGATKLWDTESYQPLGYSFHHEDRQRILCVSFSQDGQYLAYCGPNGKITLWMVKDIVPESEVRGSIVYRSHLKLNGRKLGFRFRLSVSSHLTSLLHPSFPAHKFITG